MSTGVAEPDLIASAEAARELVQVDPYEGLRRAEDALALARRHGSAEAEVAALHALGFAQHELGDPRAVRTMRTAVSKGMRAGYARRAALARRNLAVYLAYSGALRAGLWEID